MASAQKHRVFQRRLFENIATRLLTLIENVLALVENSLRTSSHRSRSLRIALGAGTLHTSPRNHRPISVTTPWNDGSHALSLSTYCAFREESQSLETDLRHNKLSLQGFRHSQLL